MSKMRINNLLMIILLAALAGYLLANRLPDVTDAQDERARIENRALAEKLAIDVAQKRTLSGWIVVAKVAAAGLALASIAGLILVVLHWLNRRAAEIRPGPDGQFPLVRVRIAGATVIHDPNRQLSAATVYALPEQADQVAIVPVIAGDLSSQERTTARAQAVALASAVHRHPPIIVPPGRGRAALPATVDADQVDAAPVMWPREIPLRGVLREIGGASLWNVVIGETYADGRRELITAPMSNLVHVGVAGVTGSGKTTFVKSLLYQFVTCPERPDLAIVDIKRELSLFSTSERLLWPVANQVGPAIVVFKALARELHRRLELFEGAGGIDTLLEYNQYAQAKGLETLKPTILVADECAVLVKQDKAVVSALQDLALFGRSAACWLVLSSQSMKTDFMPSEIREQLRTKAQFAADSKTQARVLMGTAGAEEIRDPGRALVRLPGRLEDIEVQTPTIERSAILRALAEQKGPAGGPPTVDVAQEPPTNGSGPTDGQIETVREMWANGESYSAIARAVFGTPGGSAFYKVKSIVEEWDND